MASNNDNNDALPFDQKYPKDRPGEQVTDDARIWRIYVDEATEWDQSRLESFNKDMDVLLIFAGLFSAIITAFLIESYKLLQPSQTDFAELSYNVQVAIAMKLGAVLVDLPNMPTSSRTSHSTASGWVNALWFTGLVLSLLTAFFCILAKQWLSEYTPHRQEAASKRALARIRQYRFGGLRDWRVPTFIAALPVLLHCALFLYFAGLVVFLWPLSIGISLAILILSANVLTFYIVCIFLPLRWPNCAFRTPLGRLLYTPIADLVNFFRVHMNVFRFIGKSLRTIRDVDHRHDFMDRARNSVRRFTRRIYDALCSVEVGQLWVNVQKGFEKYWFKFGSQLEGLFAVDNDGPLLKYRTIIEAERHSIGENTEWIDAHCLNWLTEQSPSRHVHEAVIDVMVALMDAVPCAESSPSVLLSTRPSCFSHAAVATRVTKHLSKLHVQHPVFSEFAHLISEIQQKHEATPKQFKQYATQFMSFLDGPRTDILPGTDGESAFPYPEYKLPQLSDDSPLDSASHQEIIALIGSTAATSLGKIYFAICNGIEHPFELSQDNWDFVAAHAIQLAKKHTHLANGLLPQELFYDQVWSSLAFASLCQRYPDNSAMFQRLVWAVAELLGLSASGHSDRTDIAIPTQYILEWWSHSGLQLAASGSTAASSGVLKEIQIALGVLNSVVSDAEDKELRCNIEYDQLLRFAASQECMQHCDWQPIVVKTVATRVLFDGCPPPIHKTLDDLASTQMLQLHALSNLLRLDSAAHCFDHLQHYVIRWLESALPECKTSFVLEPTNLLSLLNPRTYHTVAIGTILEKFVGGLILVPQLPKIVFPAIANSFQAAIRSQGNNRHAQKDEDLGQLLQAMTYAFTRWPSRKEWPAVMERFDAMWAYRTFNSNAGLGSNVDQYWAALQTAWEQAQQGHSSLQLCRGDDARSGSA